MKHGIRVSLLLSLLTVFSVTCLVSSLNAQTSLDELWPSDVGNSWRYEALTAEPDPFYFQVELSLEEDPGEVGESVVARRLVVSTLGFDSKSRVQPGSQKDLIPFDLMGEGSLRKSADTIGLWNPLLGDWVIQWLSDDLTPGATFTLPDSPDPMGGPVLNATVAANPASVTTAGGSWSDAVRMDYVLDFGWVQAIDENGTLLGLIRGETRATMHFVPGVGPVSLDEDFYSIAEVDCPDGCPTLEAREGELTRHSELRLSESPVATEKMSWGALKAGY